MATFDFSGTLPQTKALISSAQLRNRYNDIKTHINTNNVSGVVFGSTSGAAQYQAFLLDATLTAGTWTHLLRADAAMSFTGAGSLAQGDIIYVNSSGVLTRLAAGTSGQYFQTQGAGADPQWTTVATLTDGDKGDITVASSGASFTIDNDAVTTAKILNANVTFAKLGPVLTIKTTTYTAVANDQLGCDTDTTGAFTVTFPASPSAGDKIFIVDYKGTFDTANLTIDPNGNNIEGQSTNLVLNIKGFSGTFLYDATVGWKRI